MTPNELHQSLIEVITAELQLAIGYLDKVEASDITDDARLAIQHVLALARSDQSARTTTGRIVALVHESRNALVPVHLKLKPLSGGNALHLRVCVLNVLNHCTEVHNELERLMGS